jgi:hypothetical protein
MPATMLPSHASDNATGATRPAQCRCQVMQATMLSIQAGDDAAEAPWPRGDVDVKSCWQQCYRVLLRWHCRGDLAAARCRCRVMLAIMLPRHVGDGVVGVTWPRRDVNAESCWQK